MGPVVYPPRRQEPQRVRIPLCIQNGEMCTKAKSTSELQLIPTPGPVQQVAIGRVHSLIKGPFRCGMEQNPQICPIAARAVVGTTVLGLNTRSSTVPFFTPGRWACGRMTFEGELPKSSQLCDRKGFHNNAIVLFAGLPDIEDPYCWQLHRVGTSNCTCVVFGCFPADSTRHFPL